MTIFLKLLSCSILLFYFCFLFTAFFYLKQRSFRLLLFNHLLVQFKQVFQPLLICFERAAPVASFDSKVVLMVSFAQTFGHFIGIVKLSQRFFAVLLTLIQNLVDVLFELLLLGIGNMGEGEGIVT